MTKRRVVTFVLWGVVAFTSNGIAQSGSVGAPASILVDDDRVQCPDAAYSTIQGAVNAARPGEHIRVCAGTYPEQVAIDKSIVLKADNGVFVKPVGVAPNTAGLFQGDPLAAVFLVTNAVSVEISGFSMDGSANGFIDCGPRLIGILFQNSSGLIEGNVIRHFHLSPALPGCQSGNGIEIETTPGNTSNVAINNNSVDDYQKNGITANELGTIATIDGNVVTGSGPTTGTAQNGIQIGFGASGTITNNTVINHVWSPCIVITECVFNATGILVYESNDVHIGKNVLGTNQVGVYASGKHSLIDFNLIFDSLEGVAVVGNGSSIQLNKIAQSSSAAVFVQGNGNHIASNEILGASIGISEVAGSGQNTHFENRFLATVTRVSSAGTPATDPDNASDGVVPSNSGTAGDATRATQHRVSPSR